jgi:hypothetical protein
VTGAPRREEEEVRAQHGGGSVAVVAVDEHRPAVYVGEQVVRGALHPPSLTDVPPTG